MRPDNPRFDASQLAGTSTTSPTFTSSISPSFSLPRILISSDRRGIPSASWSRTSEGRREDLCWRAWNWRRGWPGNVLLNLRRRLLRKVSSLGCVPFFVPRELFLTTFFDVFSSPFPRSVVLRDVLDQALLLRGSQAFPSFGTNRCRGASKDVEGCSGD